MQFSVVYYRHLNALEGAAYYVGLLLAPAEGFGLCISNKFQIFLNSQKKNTSKHVQKFNSQKSNISQDNFFFFPKILILIFLLPEIKFYKLSFANEGD